MRQASAPAYNPPIDAPDLASPAFKADPYPFYARLRAEAPVYRTRLAFWLPACLVTRYDDVLLVLKDRRFAKDFSSKMPWLPPAIRPLNRHLLNADPPDHTRLRALVSKAFTPAVVERLRPRIEAQCHELLDRVAAVGRADLVRDYALPVPLTVIADLLGIPGEDRGQFFAWSKRVAAGTSWQLRDLLLSMPSLFAGVRYLRRLIARRRAAPGDDLVSALIAAEEEGDRLTSDEIVGMVALLLLAGYETTINLIASGTLALLQDEEARARFVADGEGVETAVEELLRFTSPAEMAVFRVAAEDVEVGGTTIRRGEVVLAVIGSANRDASVFLDPDRLDLGRAPNRHLAFGIGAHFCLGAPLARLEGEIALPALFRRFPRLRVDGAGAAMRWRRSLILRGLERLPVAVS